MSQPLQRHEFQADRLIKEYPPMWNGRNKMMVFDIACSGRHPFEGHIVYSRWSKMLPALTGSSPSSSFCAKAGIFDYGPTDLLSTVWHMNFADPDLFAAYSSSLLAQDELQVAEHPILGSLREALQAAGEAPRTVDYIGNPTPITISGVERRCAISTMPSAISPRGLYGNEFGRADEKQVRAATKVLNPPTKTNILAMAAPACGSGSYTGDQLTNVLNTAYTGFEAVKLAGAFVGAPTNRVIIHTGFWGCGAFGGNRTLVTILQSLAADLAGIDLVFWAFDDQGLQIVEEARSAYSQLLATNASTEEILHMVGKMDFKWSDSDGN
jgi:hypothetical protein